MDNLAVLVLAAGASSRMQTPKQLLKIGDKTLLELVLEKASAISSVKVICVLGANATAIQQEILLNSVTVIINHNYSKGLSSSIVAGVKYFQKKNASIERLLILLADQPAVSIEYLENLIEISEKYPTKIIASKYPKNLGVPAIFPKIFFNELLNLEGDLGANEFLQNNKNHVISTTFKATLIDLDTKEDFENYINLLEKRVDF